MLILDRCSNPVIAVTIPDNVYLTYSIFILTSAMRVTTFNLVLRADSPRLRSESLPPTEEPPDPSSKGKNKWLKPIEGPASYVSLLAEPFTVPDILSRPSGLPSNPKLSLPESAKGEFMLTPESLRYFTMTVSQFIHQSRETYLANQETESRIQLQRSEVQRLCTTARVLYSRVEKLKGPGKQHLQTRIQTAQEQHTDLMARLNRMLQFMIDKASPELSEDETRWFDELKRMKQEVIGSGSYDGDSLVHRTTQVSSSSCQRSRS